MKFDKIIIETSPFIRCVQSASNIASVLGVPEVEINFMIGEHLYARDFAEYDPIPRLNTVTANDVNDAKLRDTYKIPDSVKLVNNWRWYDNIKTRWLETLDDCHKRALIIKRNFSERLSEMAGKGELDGGKKVCYLVISHGMMVWQMGNMMEAMANNPDKYDMPNPINFKDFDESKQEALVTDCGHMDWTEDCKYMCFNGFAVKYNQDKKEFEDYRILDRQQNGAYFEYYERQAEKK